MAETDIQNFYKNKNIFLTGATGLLGKVFLEKILRVTAVSNIYVLVRTKRDQDVAHRIEYMFKEPLFEKLLQLRPTVMNHIISVCGDCSQPNLGLSDEDCATLCENVDVVIHCAATVRFNEPLSNAIAINLRATKDLLKLAKEMTKLQAFVHVSTAFANCIEPHIEESFYSHEMTSKQVLDLTQIFDSKILNRIENNLLNKYPNTYTFTKALAEEAVSKRGTDLPICIFRPGIILPTYKEPFPGWVGPISGITNIQFSIALGLLHIGYKNGPINAPVVPVDYCVNLMLSAAWQTAVQQKFRRINSTPIIYNLVPDEANMMFWSTYAKLIERNSLKLPMKRLLWVPYYINANSKLVFNILWFLCQTLPSYVFDSFAAARGKKRRMVKLNTKLYKQVSILHYFLETNWTFSMKNTKSLWKSLSPANQQLFPFDMLSIDWSTFCYDCAAGIRRYLAKDDLKTVPEAKQNLKRLMLLHRLVQILLYGCGMLLLFAIFRGLFFK